MIIISPLSVPVTKTKKFILNLNQYRNTHFYTLNKAKVVYKEEISVQFPGLAINPPIQVTYIYFPKTARKTDIGNVLSIHQKFFEDALVEGGYLVDDNYDYIPRTIFRFGEVDKENPRVEIHIEEIV